MFKHYDTISNKHNKVVIPYGTHVKVKCIGTVHLNNGLELNKVLYVSGFQYNLVSIHKLCCDRNAVIKFATDICVIQEPLMKSLLLGRLKNNIYYVEEELTISTSTMLLQLENSYSLSLSTFKNKETYHHPTACAQNKASNNTEKIKLWHLRLGHIPFNRLQVVSLIYNVIIFIRIFFVQYALWENKPGEFFQEVQ